MTQTRVNETDSSGRLRSDDEIRQLNAKQHALESLIARKPGDTMARINLASLLLARGRMQDGSRTLVEAVPTLSDDDPAVVFQLASLLQLCGETAASRTCLDHPSVNDTTRAEVLHEHANQRFLIGEISEALALLERALSHGLDGPGERQLHATLLQFCGRMEEASESFDTCLERWPRFGSAAMARSRLRKQTPESNHVEYLQTTLEKLPAHGGNPAAMQVRAEFEMALFKEFDDLGEYDNAWAALERGKALLRTLLPYDASSETTLTDALIEASGKVPAASASGTRSSRHATPIFIIGLPRSGTTLLDRMLSSHSQVVSAGELRNFRRGLLWSADIVPGTKHEMLKCLEKVHELDYETMGERFLEQAAWATQGMPFFIDKQPLNLQFVPFLRRAFPNAPILHIVRDPVAVCFSNYKILYGQVTAYNNDLQSLAHYYTQSQRLVRQWHANPDNAILRVDYAALVNDPASVMQEVLEHCKLPLEQACIHPERNTSPVATPSSNQVREPIHARSLEDWHHYAKQLEPLRAAVQPKA